MSDGKVSCEGAMPMYHRLLGGVMGEIEAIGQDYVAFVDRA